jgi:nitrite reductase (cytochrome c-552)
VSEAELKQRAETIQERTVQLTNLAKDAVFALIEDIKAAKARGAGDEQLGAPDGAWACQRKASYLLDLIMSENSVGFHAPQESARVLAMALDWARKGQVAVRAIK